MSITVKIELDGNTQWELTIEEAKYLYEQLSLAFKAPQSPVYEETAPKPYTFTGTSVVTKEGGSVAEFLATGKLPCQA